MSLFRPEAVKHQSQQTYGEVLLLRPTSLTVLSCVAALVAVTIIAYLAWGSYTRKARLAGTLAPEHGLIKLYPNQPGQVAELRVREGQAVRKGDVLLVLSGERVGTQGQVEHATATQIASRRASLRMQLAQTLQLARQQATAGQQRMIDLKAELRQAGRELETQRRRLQLAEQAQQQFADLRKAGFSSSLQAQAKDEDLLAQRASLQALERNRMALQRELTAVQFDLADQPLRNDNQAEGLRRELTAVEQEAVQSEARRALFVVAPQDGTVTAILTEAGQTIQTSQALASLVPADTELEAFLYAPSRSVGFVKPGQKVLLRYQAYPYQKFGQHKGTVASVSRAPLAQQDVTIDNPGREALYRITVKLDAQEIMAYGKLQALQPGMQIDADIELDTRSLLEWVMEPLFSLTGKW